MRIRRESIFLHLVLALGLVALLAPGARAEEVSCPCFDAKLIQSKCSTGADRPRLYISEGSDGHVQFSCYNEYVQELMINLYDPQKDATRRSDESLPQWQRDAPSCKYDFGYRESKKVTSMSSKEFTVCMSELKDAARLLKVDCHFERGGGPCSPLGR